MLKALSVSELNEIVKNIFDAEELLSYIKVYGEVSNLAFVRNNLYFNLKDEGALIPCVMFGATSCSVKDGDQVMVTGGLKFYVKSGKLNLYATSIAPYGSGVLFKKFLELKNKLEQEGVFDEKYKKPIPKKIKTIGVITSTTGAVLHDIITVTQRRNPYLDIVVYPARVQGEGAENTIISGLRYFNREPDIDVVIIARGGGSIEDLAPFNTESLAREIIKIDKPVISAVGHETDFTICDFASSLRVATPSVAGEIVSEDITGVVKQLKSNVQKLNYLYFFFLDEKYFLLDKITSNLKLKLQGFLLNEEYKLKNSLNLLKSIDFTTILEHNLEAKNLKLLSLDVNSILDKGFAKIIGDDGKVIKSIKQINANSKILVEIKDGKFKANVLEIGG